MQTWASSDVDRRVAALRDRGEQYSGGRGGAIVTAVNG
jgi:hypothetical protein